MVPPAEPRSYYGRPVIKEPVWTAEIPAYFFAGGMAAACAPLALGASLSGNPALARSASGVALAGAALSPVLLVSELGRPERFLNMLRLVKPTSPMSVGVWVLGAFGPAAALGAARELLGRMPRAGRAGQVGAALLGPALGTYTAVLLANTAVPVWHEARRELPLVFAGSAMASAGAATALLTVPGCAGPARRLALAGAAIELAAGQAMERGLGELGEPYRQGALGRLHTGAKALTAAGAALTMAGGRRRGRAGVAGAGLVLAGAALTRWSVFRAGFASARDPKYTVGPQRERVGERVREREREPVRERVRKPTH
jgi:formate-dependent nitrite reductase membrane component NrfD